MVDYNPIAKKFAKSRMNMKWPELEYFFSHIQDTSAILDVGCGSGRFLEQYKECFGKYPKDYLGIDLSSGLIAEAQRSYPDHIFVVENMLHIGKNEKLGEFDIIFMIASFHHLSSMQDREEVIKSLFSLLKDGGKIYMTNWDLSSRINQGKYGKDIILHSHNRFNSMDYNIKFGDYDRFYHSFHIKELEYLSKLAGFTVIENRLFDSEKNIITILQK